MKTMELRQTAVIMEAQSWSMTSFLLSQVHVISPLCVFLIENLLQTGALTNSKTVNVAFSTANLRDYGHEDSTVITTT